MLSWREDRATIAFIVGAVLVVLLIAALAWWGSGDDPTAEPLEPRTPYSWDTDDAGGADGAEGSEAAEGLEGITDPFDPALDARFGTADPPGGPSDGADTRDYLITSSSDAPMAGVVWRIVRTDHGEVRRNVRSTRGAATVTEPSAFGQINVVAGPGSTRVECTVRVNGEVVDRQRASGPWAQVFCQG